MSSLVPALSRRLLLAVLLGVLVAPGLVGCRPSASSTQGASPVGAVAAGHAPRLGRPSDELPRVPDRGRTGSRDLAEGEVPEGATVFDDQYPAVAKLDPDLLAALRRAATDAATDGVRFAVDSGWRSRAYQDRLFRQAVEKYGSAQQAAQWVARPSTSAHEAGRAVDLGPSRATEWLAAHGAAYGLCQIYANEPWHYELRPDAETRGCPAMYADPTHDPRTQR